MFLTRISVNHPVFATMIMVAILVLGLSSWQRLTVEQMPDVDIPVVAVVVSYDGASPEAVENDVIKPIEDSMVTISGLDTIQATAQTGQALIVMQFELNVTSSEAMSDVRDKLSAIEASLPERADKPTILRFDPSATSVISLALSSKQRSIEELTEIAEDKILNPIRNISGVGSAVMVGGVDAQLAIDIDPNRLAAQGIPIAAVTEAIASRTSDLPAGAITQSANEQSIQVKGSLTSPEDFGAIILARRTGQPIYLSDVATVGIQSAETTSLALLNGQRALAIDVRKVQGANTVEVARQVQASVQRLTSVVLPNDIEIKVIANDATAVETSVEAVKNMLIEGAILSVLIVFVFLNSWRSTIITGLTLPISIIGTMVALRFFGFSLNIMTLMALSLSVGILIDDAIVVRENIMRHLHMGKSHRAAALDGTKEIGLAVLATTLSIVAVFLPVAFMEGIMGRFFLQFGVTVSVAVMISLFVAFTLDPMMSSIWYDPAADPNVKRGPVGRMLARFERGFERLTDGYTSVLRWSLRYRGATLAAAAAIFVASFGLLALIGAEFLPTQDNGKVSVAIETEPGSSLDYTAARAAQVENMLRQRPEVASTYATVAAAVVGAGTSNQATIAITLVPQSQRQLSAIAFADAARAALKDLPGLSATVGVDDGFGGTGKPIELVVFGPDTETLRRIGNEVAARMKSVPGVEDIESSMETAQPSIGLKIDEHRASELGVTPAQISAAMSSMMSGSTVASWTSPESQSYDVVVRLAKDARAEVDMLGAMPVGFDANGSAIYLDEIASVESATGQAEILRQGLERRVTVDANLSSGAPGDAYGRVMAISDQINLPEGYRFGFGGDAEELEKAGSAAGSALLLAVVFIYLVLASQFGSILQPLAIMASLPLSLVGVLLGLLVGGSTLNMMSMIGFIMLMGLVVKNAILLVDNANQEVRAGVNLYDALVAAGRMRFRPIVMTTLAMILGMLPLALNLHTGSDQNAPMAHAVIGGLISSTMLTLVVVPVLLTYLVRLGNWARAFFPPPPADHEITSQRT